MRKILFLGILAGVFVSFGETRPVIDPLNKSYTDPVPIIQRDYEEGKIDLETATIYKAYALFDYDKLPEKYQGKKIRRCATFVVSDIEHSWKKLSPETKNILSAYFRALPGDTSTALIPPANLTETYRTTHFTFHYTTEPGDSDAVPPEDKNENDIPDYVEDFGEIFEYCWNKEIQGLKYGPIPGEYLPVDVYIKNITDYGFVDQATMNIYVDNDYITDPNGRHYPGNPEYNKKVTAAHEFFHEIQFTAYDKDEDHWWCEASAVWMEDEVYDGINYYVDYLRNIRFPYNIFSRPEMPLDTVGAGHEYSAVVYLKFLSEHHGIDFVRKIWTVCMAVQGPNSLQAIQFCLKGQHQFQQTFQDFTCANYIKTGPDGYEEGLCYPPIHIEQEYNTVPPNNNQHYAKDYPSYVGSPVPWEENIFSPSGNPIALPHLASHYIWFMRPVDVDTTTHIYISFKGEVSSGLWGLSVVKVNNRYNKEKVIVPVDSATNSIYDYEMEIGGSNDDNINEIIIIPVNRDTSAVPTFYKYSICVVPVFQASYEPDAKNGSTKRVLNLDEDNTYLKGERVRLMVDISDKVEAGGEYTLNADFSRVDKDFKPEDVMITEVDAGKHEYEIEYKLSDNLNYSLEEQEVPIRVKDLTNSDSHKSNTIIFKMRVVKTPKVKETNPTSGQLKVPVNTKITFVRR